MKVSAATVPVTASPAPDPGRWRFRLILLGLTAMLILTITTAVTIGPVSIPPLRVWQIVLHELLPGLLDPSWPASQQQIVWELRLPRVLLGGCVGAGLAVVGTTLQALVRNPLADPYVFGITSGASVGATIVLVLGVTTFGVYSLSVAAFLGAVVAFGLVLLLARTGGGLSPARLILSGVAVAYTMSALTSYLVFQASTSGDQGVAQSVLFWLLGGLGGSRWSYLGLPAAAIAVATVLLMLQARSLNAMLVGEETAATLGINLRRFRQQLFTLSALLTGVMVAVSGGIGFVGLMMPHAVRMLVGADHRRVLPIAMLLGAIFLCWADVVARTAAAPQELPIGIITALCGTPFFVWIMRSHASAKGSRRG